jgi:hypothetical protein
MEWNVDIIQTASASIIIITVGNADHIVACLLGNVTNNLWFLDLTLDLLDIRQAELQLIITPLILL